MNASAHSPSKLSPPPSVSLRLAERRFPFYPSPISYTFHPFISFFLLCVFCAGVMWNQVGKFSRIQIRHNTLSHSPYLSLSLPISFPLLLELRFLVRSRENLTSIQKILLSLSSRINGRSESHKKYSQNICVMISSCFNYYRVG